MIVEFMSAMIGHFEMTDLGLMSYFLGIEVTQTDDAIFVSQKKYIGDMLKKFKMEGCKPMLIPVEERLKLEKEGFDMVKDKEIIIEYCHSEEQEEHPSALDSFEDMIAVAEGKKLVLFLDYDGTLSPIVNDPEKAFMSDAMRVAVREVANLFPTAIISGRCIDKVNGFVKLNNVVYAGSHGMDIWTPTGSLKYGQQNKSIDEQGNKVVKFQPAQEFLPTVKEIIQVMEKKIKTFEGAMVEDNRFCVSVHYRNVDEKEVDTLKEMVHSTMKAFPKFCINGGKMVMEIRPSINWNKGRALEYLLDTFGFTGSSDFLPLYIGDDTTDEDAFEV
ncbi:hypothetical protein EZV62_013888 [Acer yangbiense]|uniref:Trehalose 6-phosphate phosphatase n=1 Tax=Acer yangbiense TaxID=1000413 RepID=A0A5C7HR90_9ROSI|nr:hypothetical protein EZV62_013888 [Acer yangbiense]